MRCVYRSFDHADAEIIAGLLRAEGCPAHVFENGLSRINWPYVIAYGGFRVVVTNEARDDAMEVLARWRRGDYCLNDTHDDPPCPRCANGDIENSPSYRGWAFVLTYLFSLPLLWPLKWRMRCNACGFHWRSPPPQTYASIIAAVQDTGTPTHHG